MTKDIASQQRTASPQLTAFTPMVGSVLYVLPGLRWAAELACYMLTVALHEEDAPRPHDAIGAGDRFRAQTFALPSGEQALTLRLHENSLTLASYDSPSSVPADMRMSDVSFDLRYEITWVGPTASGSRDNISLQGTQIQIPIPEVSDGGSCAQSSATVRITAYAFPKDSDGNWATFDDRGAKIPVLVDDPIVIITPPGCGT